jgi:uncharacterized protein with NRDE domain
MCLLVLAWQSHPRYRLVLAGNRDEFHARPSAAAGWWQDAAQILGGRDLEAGGTWLGVSRDGGFGVVTNYREIAAPTGARRSRGSLITEFLLTGQDAAGWSSELHAQGADYSGFNLLVGDREQLHYVTNRGPQPEPLDPGVYGLSNRCLDTPWPKLTRARAGFEEIIQNRSLDAEALFGMLADRRQADEADLPDTGIPHDWERLLSSIFIVSPDYGTRASTVLLIGHDDRVSLEERRFDPDGELQGQDRFEFDIAGDHG